MTTQQAAAIDKKVILFVNNRKFETNQDELTGTQIKDLAGVPSDYELFLVHGNESQPVGPTEVVQLKNGVHFRAIPAGTFGSRRAATS
ncbi:MAG: multiubiquitin domain-containing protein [Gemmatimonadales bacterium]